MAVEEIDGSLDEGLISLILVGVGLAGIGETLNKFKLLK
jgi:hypothetical protein